MRNPFRKGYKITLNRVYDRVIIRENGETLALTVNGDTQRMVAGLTNAQHKMKEIANGEPTPEQTREISQYFASVIFGVEQAKKLSEFYADDPGSVINVCGKYFRERLVKLISKEQKKMNV